MSVRTPFPSIVDRIGAVGPHQRRFRSHAERHVEMRYARRERALQRHQYRRRERVPVLTQLRADWGYLVLWLGIGVMFAVVFVIAPLQTAPTP